MLRLIARTKFAERKTETELSAAQLSELIFLSRKNDQLLTIKTTETSLKL